MAVKSYQMKLVSFSCNSHCVHSAECRCTWFKVKQSTSVGLQKAACLAVANVITFTDFEKW